MLRALFFTFTMMFLLSPSEILAQESTRTLTLEDATRIADAAQDRADQDGWTVAIAIVDNGGHLVLLRRIDGTQIGSINFAIQKAESSVYYQRPTKAFQDGMNAGNTQILNLPGAAAFEGGVPIVYDGKVIGAIGVSGVTAEQDGIIAEAGLSAL